MSRHARTLDILISYHSMIKLQYFKGIMPEAVFMKNKAARIPSTVARRILQRCAENEVIVVVPQNGRPSRVFRLEKYLKMRDLPRTVKPWEGRKAKQAVPDPLGAVEGTVLSSLSRKEIYE